jgi:hypothetical protein
MTIAMLMRNTLLSAQMTVARAERHVAPAAL